MMDRKKQLKRQYQEIEVTAGVYQIKNSKNGKVYIDSTRNLKTINGVKFTLNNNTYFNKKLQEDWNKYGENSFLIEVLETLEKEDSPYFNEKEALKKLEEKWLAKCQPFGDGGYN